MLGKAIKAIVTAIVGFLAVGVVNSEVNSMDTTGLSNANKSLFSLLPLVFTMMVIMSIIKSLGVDSPAEQIDWLRYGERMKLAYAAKFGGRNNGFDSEVDERINRMVNTDKGFYRQLAKVWLKRMSKFTDLEWLSMTNSNNKE